MRVIFVVAALVAYSSASLDHEPLEIGFPSFAELDIGDRIINGTNATNGQYPYQVSYQRGNLGTWSHVCGGSLITPTAVLTAAHCIGAASIQTRVVVGITSLDDASQTRQNILISQQIKNSKYQNGVGPYDIGLLKLARPVALTKLVQLIRLPAPGTVALGPAVLTGWGRTGTSSRLPNILQTLNVPILSTQACRNAIQALYGNRTIPFDNVSNICTGPLLGGISACNGDSGGPLVQNGTVVGIVSWGFIPCGRVGAPSVYTNVASFIDFIKEHVTDLPSQY